MQKKQELRRKRTDREASATAIVNAALTLFLQKGYRAATTDEIATQAKVSKQTIYRNFPDKAALFNTLVRESIDRAQSFLKDTAATFSEAEDLGAALRAIALGYLDTVFSPHVLQLRRLIIGEAQHFPELAQYYYREVPGRTLDTLAEDFKILSKRGLLRVRNAQSAARHFAALLIMLPLDRAMFGVVTSRSEMEQQALEGIDAFLSAYGIEAPGTK